MAEIKALIIDSKDNVAVVIEDVKKGDTVITSQEKITASEDIKTGHKIARFDIPKGGMIIKYNAVIARANTDINTGDWVHCHNIDDITEELCEKYSKEYRQNGGRV